MKTIKNRVACVISMVVLLLVACLALTVGAVGKTAVAETVVRDVEKNAIGTDFQAYKDAFVAANPQLDVATAQKELLGKIGYTDKEIELLSESTKEQLLQSKSVNLERSVYPGGLEMTVSFRRMTLTLAINNYLPVDYYLVHTLWTWNAPDCIGSSDYIGINLEDNKNYYSLPLLKANSPLAAYAFCRMTYDQKIYNGTTVMTNQNLSAQCGEIPSNDRTSRNYAVKMPTNVVEYEEPGDPFVYKTVHVNFRGECQFILDISPSVENTNSQIVGITYGHTTKRYERVYNESNDVSIGVSVSGEGPSLGIEFSAEEGWWYTAEEVIHSYMETLDLRYERIGLENNKVYYIINLTSRRALEYAAGETGSHTQLRLGAEELIGNLNPGNLSNADRQFRIQYDPTTYSITLKPIRNPNVHVAFSSDNYVTLEKDPAISGYATTGGLTVDSYQYIIPQHNIPVTNLYRVMSGSNIMTYDTDFYSSVICEEVTQTDSDMAAWIFYEVPSVAIGYTSVTESVASGDVCMFKNAGTQKYMDVSGESIDNGAPIIQYTKGIPVGYNQQFVCKADGINYELAPYHTIGFRVDVTNASASAGTNIQQYGENGTIAQDFKFLPVQKSDNKVLFMIATRVSGYSKVLAFADASDGTVLQQVVPNMNDANQLWIVEFMRKDPLVIDAHESYYFRNIISDHYFDVDNADTASGTNLSQYFFNGNNNQRFKLKSMGDGSFVLIPQHATNRAVEVLSNAFNNSKGNKDGANIRIATYDSSATKQRFKFLRKSIESFKIFTGCSNYSCAVGVSGDIDAAPANLCQWNDSSSDTKTWIIERAESSSILSCNVTAQVNINGTTARTYYFTAYCNGFFYFETFGGLHTNIDLYLDATGLGTYDLVKSSSSGGSYENAMVSYLMDKSNRVKIVVRGYDSNQSGYAGLSIHR